MKHTNSIAMFQRAKDVIPGGVNSPVRAFGSVNTTPIFIKKAKGAYVEDIDDNKYLDYISSWGPLIFGHNDPQMMSEMKKAMENGVTYGVPSVVEVEMAEAIRDAYPACEKIRMVNSGTEATMSAIRVARGYTGKNNIIKFEGCYHGHSDALLVKSGSGTLTFGIPTSLGVPTQVIENTIVCQFNDIQSVKQAIDDYGDTIAAVIIEPVPGNMGVVKPDVNFMKSLREMTEAQGIILIFDEVITGFRLAYGGASEVLQIQPDMVCFGKIIGGGLPVGAYGGRADIMNVVSPIGGVYQAGTLSGNPLAMHMGLETLKRLRESRNIYQELENKAKILEDGFIKNLEELKIPLTINRFRSMISLFMAEGPINNFVDVQKSDTSKYAIYFKEMLNQNILLPPAQFEAMFMNTAISNDELEYTIICNKKALEKAFF